MMKCEYCGKPLLLVEVATVEYAQHTKVLGYDYTLNNISKWDSEMIEVLYENITHYICYHCKKEIIIPPSYGSVENQLAVWLQFNPDYQKEK